ncbi:endonuclease [Photobacterium galatheae]|uniref:Serine protease n=1 Tax=Photobacterium galatheae TaxID=1654360 RepID=A0A066RJJ9_9GAMM|nr:endonuclease [Photobacterium galatheae]KDM90509.1 hypothetical protein EA58_16410 [Photobacterium galatheae]MCM0148029.1 endonuclease [Photobacterium galatheae]
MKERTKSYYKLLSEVEKRIPDVDAQLNQLDNVLKGKKSWQSVEEKERVMFRLKNITQEREDEKLIDLDDRHGSLLERIILFNELLPISFLYRGARIAKTVGRVNVRSEFGLIGHGTGFMVSPRLMMTNNHVLENETTARFSMLEMNFRLTSAGMSQSSFFRLLPDTFFFTDEHLDFTLVAVEAVNSQGDRIADYGFNPLIRQTGKALVGEHVNIIQHPLGEPKQISVRQNKIIGKEGPFLHYVTDTQQGSSGSPVCNDAWDVVALHHAGKPKRDERGNILLIDGSVWDGNPMTQGQIHWEANEGVRISEILKKTDDVVTGMTASAQQLYQAIFTATPPTGDVESTVHPQLQPNTQVVGHDGQDSTNLYLRINIAPMTEEKLRLSLLGTQHPGTHVVKDAERREPPIVISGTHADHIPDSPPDRTRLDYYDPDADKVSQEIYYANVDLTLPPEDLYKALSKLLSQTHTTQLSYREARLEHLYPVVDRHEFGKLRNIYSGTVLDPEEVVRAEKAMIQQHAQEMRMKVESEGLLSEAARAEALDILEASLPFNCEHVVPQSWFEKRNPMRADMHHLFACEPDCNSFRSNIPYWQFDPLDESLHTACGRREGNKFEPENGRGAVARATLYFLLRYPFVIGDDHNEMKLDRLNILLKWHQQHPVSRYERHRNSTIFAVQGNRNPLIDFPHLAEQIDFSLGFA